MTTAEYDTYATVEYADSLISDTFLETTAWDTATESKRLASLVQASEIINNLAFLGSKADAEQSLQFPRGTDTTIPTNIQKACVHIAYALLDGINIEVEYQNQAVASQKIGDVQSTYSGELAPHILAGVPSITAWRYLFPYLKSQGAFRLERAS